MRLFLLLLLAPSALSADVNDPMDPDVLAFMTAISMGRGLYSNFHDIVLLNGTNFDATVKNKEHSWIIEFYNSWCGHCLRFTTTYKRFAVDIKGWNDIVKIGAVDCSNELNTPLCRVYEILSYPTLKYFPPNFKPEFFGVDVFKRKIDDLREAVVSNLKNRPDLPQLQPFAGSRQDLAKNTGQIVILVVECNAVAGPQLVLDFHKTAGATVVPASCNASQILGELNLPADRPAIYLISKTGPPKTLVQGAFSRNEALEALHANLQPLGIESPLPYNLTLVKNLSIDINSAFAMAQLGPQWKEKVLSRKLTDQVFQVDIEGALRHTLNVEIPSHKHINGSMFETVKNYLAILYDYFPIGENGKNFIQCAQHKLAEKGDSVLGVQFADDVTLCQNRYFPVYLDPHGGWLGCQGSLPAFRGFPCSMWTMFHTLTVQAYNKGTGDPQQVLKVMASYIGTFFGCTDCANHFTGMAKHLSEEVTSHRDSILWLWKAHNKVNKRLHGDQTEDPYFPKVQFPPATVCPKCTLPNGIHDEEQTVEFLRRMYTNISYIVASDVKPPPASTPSDVAQDAAIAAKLVRHEIVADEDDSRTHAVKILWDFSLFDVSLCVVLYVFSMAIIVLVCIKFLRNRRSYRKKPYYSDVF
ncbi:unnamed protein product [Nesidiocoris tenuis]|uniref:Sulfhydryl oxidase n=1 Tax=Nesidiocoris tenuis TaxID=355587 RepID=A0A6H5GSJ9_9HEMI|nr:unnamed protein product [Nesidiocoris tenuis]